MASINCISQSNDGYLWIGTDGGELIRFDGKSFEEINSKKGDYNHHYEGLFTEGNYAYFASKYKGFYKINLQTNKIQCIHKGINGAESIGIYKLNQKLFFASKDGLFFYSKNNIKKIFTHKESNFEIYHHTKIEDVIILFTNAGSLVISKDKCIPLHQWLGVQKNKIEKYDFGVSDKGKLVLFSKDAKNLTEIVFNENGSVYSFQESMFDSKLEMGEDIKFISLNILTKEIIVISNLSRLYKISSLGIQIIPNNYDSSIEAPTQLYTDLNGTIWIGSLQKGLYRISLEPFTKLEIDPLYSSQDISFIYKTKQKDVIISIIGEGTFIKNFTPKNQKESYNFRTYGIAEFDKEYYLATSEGIKLLNSNSIISDFLRNDESITFIKAEGDILWFGVANEGLFKHNLSTKETTQIISDNIVVPTHFYSAQFLENKNRIFGTNSGLYIIDSRTNEISKIKLDYNKLGTYSGVSTKDIHNTRWFTLEKGIVGITSKGKIIILEGKKYFNTNLFFTLCSDLLGNLIVGTNKGITILNVNSDGKPVTLDQYNDQSGFFGYETNMRCQFTSGNQIFLGTVEGLFLINTELLIHSESKISPIIKKYAIASSGKAGNDFKFTFHVNNAKSGKIQFSYRVKGLINDWIILKEKSEIELLGLENGEYVIECRASFDGIHFSEPSYYKFKVNRPYWRSSWFILIAIISIVFLNILLLKYNKAFDTNRLLDTKDTSVHLRMTPNLLLFGFIASTGSNIIAPLLHPELELHLAISIIIGFSLLTIYFLSLNAKHNNTKQHYNKLLITALIIIIAQFYYELYASHLHPFHLIGIILTSTAVPFILGNIKSTIVFAFSALGLSVICAFLINNPVYPKEYFFIAIIVMLGLIIFTSYLRFDSLEKMMFISAIINKGSIPAIAFDKNGMITYSSENISSFINSDHSNIINKHISHLNSFIPFDGSQREFDITNNFKDGETYLTPLVNKENKVRWVEWSFKEFASNVNVILGQDISERLELENTYEILVQNAEDFIVQCSINGEFVFVNDICYTKLGYTKEEVIGAKMTEIIPMEYREDVAKFYLHHFKNKEKSSYKEFPILKKNGDVIWIGQHVTTLFAPGSTSFISGFICLARDISNRRTQQALIQKQQDSITSSINYARRIQFNLLPHERVLTSCFKEHFIIYKPKDIVSGDFYWMEKIGSQTILALSDCTGHGVPGSFMSLLGINLLNSIIHEGQFTDPGKILNELDRRLIDILPKGKGINLVNDGMEITICVLDDKSNELSFACAGSRFLIQSEGQFTMFKGDNKHIGDPPYIGFESYKTSFTTLNDEDQLYLFTDGFQDQFGGENDKKFSFRKLLVSFEENAKLPLHQQKSTLENDFDKWIGQNDQTDDVTILSIIRNPTL